ELQDLQTQSQTVAVDLSARLLQERTANLAKDLLAGRVKQDAAQPAHPLHTWAVLGSLREGTDGKQFAAKRQQLLDRLQVEAAQAAESEGRSRVLVDFTKDDYRDWFVTGDAFGTAPTTAPAAVLQANQGNPVKLLLPAGMAHSGLVSSKLQGVLRSET